MIWWYDCLIKAAFKKNSKSGEKFKNVVEKQSSIFTIRPQTSQKLHNVALSLAKCY